MTREAGGEGRCCVALDEGADTSDSGTEERKRLPGGEEPFAGAGEPEATIVPGGRDLRKDARVCSKSDVLTAG